MAFYNDHDEKGKCFACGEKPDAFWKGQETVNVCQSCAIEILPKLLADSVIANIPIRKIASEWLYRDFKREKDIKIY